MKFWNKNFGILTIGSFISALGSSAAGIGFGFLIYERTRSPLLLALFTVANILPRVITNFLVGPFIDRNSRKKIIVSLDFFYAIAFCLITLILFNGYFNVMLFTFIAVLFGIVDTIYQTAFMSIFPEVIPEGHHSRAYSISSLIWPLSAAVMSPIAAFFIDNFENGIAILMLFNTITFIITATLETTIKVEEKLNTNVVKGLQFINDMKEGFNYLRTEKGILGIGLLFAAFSFVYAAHNLLRMPYFVEHDVFTLQHFSFLVSAGALGRIVGGLIHYLFKYPPSKKYIIAVSVYISVELMSATLLFMPYFIMVIISFIIGLLSVTSFNIRMSSTQTYIPVEKRGRINSTQQFLWNLGAISGVLIIGLIAEYSNFDYRYIMLFTGIVTLSAILIFPIRMKEEFKNIYNRNV